MTGVLAGLRQFKTADPVVQRPHLPALVQSCVDALAETVENLGKRRGDSAECQD